jgi:hypothetical protein
VACRARNLDIDALEIDAEAPRLGRAVRGPGAGIAVQAVIDVQRTQRCPELDLRADREQYRGIEPAAERDGKAARAPLSTQVGDPARKRFDEVGDHGCGYGVSRP